MTANIPNSIHSVSFALFVLFSFAAIRPIRNNYSPKLFIFNAMSIAGAECVSAPIEI